MPTLSQIQQHAKRYGPDHVMEAAAELDFSFDDLVKLQTFLDKLEVEKKGKWAKKHRLTVEERVERLLGIDNSPEAA